MLSSINVENFRCVEQARLEFDPGATGIVGANASGKTSLLESIYFLGHGRSFRVAQREKLVRGGAEYLRVVGSIQSGSEGVALGAEYRDGEVRVQLSGRLLRGFSEVAEVFPIQVIDPGVHRILEEGSARRRRLLDWGVFHVEHGFLQTWRRYHRALQQRNAALRAGHPFSQVSIWNSELSSSAQTLDEQRSRYLANFVPELSRWTSELVGPGVQVDYRRGWRAGCALEDALSEVRSRDQRLKTTSVGPHRADLLFALEGVPARDRISRGQQKMLASAFVLALIALRARESERRTCLLLDDPAAELDVDNLGKLLGALSQLRAQLIVTAVSEAGLRGLSVGRVFHVEQGRVSPML